VKSIPKLAATIAFMALPLIAHADGDWVLVSTATADRLVYEAKAGTQRLLKNRAGQQIIVMTGRTRTVDGKGDILFQQWHIRLDHCKAGVGELVVSNLAGEVMARADYVRNGGSNASNVADTLCGIAAILNGNSL